MERHGDAALKALNGAPVGKPIIVQRLRIQTREQAFTGRAAHGDNNVGVGETDASVAKAIQVRRPHVRVIRRMQYPIIEVVEDNE
jgi:hypothetical protein